MNRFHRFAPLVAMGLSPLPKSEPKPTPKIFTVHDEARIHAAAEKRERRERRDALRAENNRRTAAGKTQ